MPKKTCFIIMPIATPKTYFPKYKDDPNHFKHVLECLFIPAIEKADLDPKRPSAKGTELIHGRIVKQIETADYVFCDISTLNPNVFFELGLRTALNKPLCLVRDDVTENIPFDLTVLNHHTYKSALNTWEMDEEIRVLNKHLIDTKDTTGVHNELWKYFGLSSIAAPMGTSEFSSANVLSFVTSQIESLRQEIGGLKSPQPGLNPSDIQVISMEGVINQVYGFASRYKIAIKTLKPQIATGGYVFDIYIASERTDDFPERVMRFERDLELHLKGQADIKDFRVYKF